MKASPDSMESVVREPFTLVFIRAFLKELLLPVRLFCSGVEFLNHQFPQLKAFFKRTPWLSSLSGQVQYRPYVWFDGERYHAIVKTRMSQSDKNEVVFCRCGHFTCYKAASAAARKQAISMATMKILHRQTS
ncbi:TPA: hypothetical protein KIA93_000296 [Salmonella enterica]|uniref:hypothetical protein n=1 Tax=Salmonella enterica TaxID=28901 RepID=UPI001119A409|nr:hypothetical protein [Salmonella enterica]HBD1844090.1 hypothetical protein [Salmonella enterica]